MLNIISERHKRGFLISFPIDKKIKILFAWRALTSKSYFWVKMGRGGLGAKTKKFCIIVRNNILRKIKKWSIEKLQS